MSVIYLAFANSSDSDSKLPFLSEEEESIRKVLEPLSVNKQFSLIIKPSITPDQIAADLTNYRNELILFLYSGHADESVLLFDDQAAHAEGLAGFLGACPKLRLVFLNGCSTGGQVEGLLKANVAAVLATSAKIDDNKAAKFSMRFFETLANQGSIDDAFAAGKNEVTMRDPNIKPSLSHELPGWGSAAPSFIWGLFTLPDQKSVLTWQLPSNIEFDTDEKYEPNKLLIQSLLESLSPYRKEIQTILKSETSTDEGDFEEMGESEFQVVDTEDAVADKIALIKAALPRPISQQINKLLVEPAPGTAQRKHYHKVGLDRLQQFYVIYATLIDIVAFTALSQIWELTRVKDENETDQAVQITDEQRKVLRQYFQSSITKQSNVKFGDLMHSLEGFFSRNGIHYFMEELPGITEKINDQTDFASAVQFFETLDHKLQGHIEESEAKQLCVVGEKHLSAFVKEIGFLANYSLVSIKAIDVEKYPHRPTPRFKHRIINLEPTKEKLEEKFLVGKSSLDCNSVLLRKGLGKANEYLNLSPFVIDRSAFVDKASRPNLYFFDRYDPDSDAFAFKHVYQPNDPPLLIREGEDLQIIKDQFNAFTKILFEKPLSPA
ncbi:MAG: CHAT domain-containing protein [Saprospiraceae bacterium]|nr:CHAT domain-containing protein [Saprospiraceae bacterium]